MRHALLGALIHLRKESSSRCTSGLYTVTRGPFSSWSPCRPSADARGRGRNPAGSGRATPGPPPGAPGAALAETHPQALGAASRQGAAGGAYAVATRIYYSHVQSCRTRTPTLAARRMRVSGREALAGPWRPTPAWGQGPSRHGAGGAGGRHQRGPGGPWSRGRSHRDASSPRPLGREGAHSRHVGAALTPEGQESGHKLPVVMHDGVG